MVATQSPQVSPFMIFLKVVFVAFSSAESMNRKTEAAT